MSQKKKKKKKATSNGTIQRTIFLNFLTKSFFLQLSLPEFSSHVFFAIFPKFYHVFSLPHLFFQKISPTISLYIFFPKS